MTLTAWQHLSVLLASVGGVGRVPVAPATVGSAVTVALYLLLPADATVQIAMIALVTAVGVWSSGMAAWLAHDPDPHHVVIDEVAGMLVACFLVPKAPAPLLTAFLVFRILDIGKWFPMNALERLPRGWGVMADDLAAGLLTRLILLGVWR